MSYDFKKFKNELTEIENWLVKEFSSIRTGMASPALLDGVRVENYGNLSPLNQVSAISTEDAKTLRVTPWDKSQIKGIEKAITVANLGVSVSADSVGVRVSFPELTSERRIMLIKVAKEKLEKARVSVRSERDNVWSDIQKIEKEGEIDEDEKFRAKEEMEKIVKEANEKLEGLFNKKDKEISI